MRVVNDQSERSAPEKVDLLSVLMFSVLISMGTCVGFLAGLPMILAQARLPEPWGKVASVIGAVLALSVWGISPVAVVLIFVIGTYLADTVVRGGQVWPTLAKVTVLGTLAAVGAMVVLARMESMELAAYWHKVVDSLIKNMQAIYQLDPSFDWEGRKQMLFSEGPFFFVAALVFASWLTIGMAAHFEWFSEGQGFTPAALRNSLLPVSLGIVFCLLAIGLLTVNIPARILSPISGAVDILAAIMAIQGTMLLSRYLNHKGVRRPLRGLVYSFSLTFGLYGLIAIGALAPVILRKKKNSF